MARSLAGILVLLILATITPSVALAQTAEGFLPPPRSASPGDAQVTSATDSPLAATLRDVAPAMLPPPAQPPAHVPGPYFRPDPLLDSPELPPLGCFATAEATLLVPHIRYWSNINGTVSLSNGTTDTVSVPGAHLDATVSPSLLLGYRLPAGFGEFAGGYRGFSTSGNQTLPGPDGPSNVHTRLDMNMADFEYASSEFSLWPWLDMRWHVGGRFADIYADSRQTTAFALAAAGSGVTDRHVVDRFYGFGPHFGLKLAYFLHDKDLALVTRVDGSFLFGRIHQSFGETTTTPGPDGTPVSGNSPFNSSQEVPILNVQVGIRWLPLSNVEVFAGYQYEHWWEVGRLGNINTNGEMYNHGLIVRAGIGY
jgi:Legionella pneumophila major outer membrane protein precursor